ncbi:MbtH family protein [Kitasatospora purpeofusca]|uniref:MbtH family NRPS accessory protein n=1 Tax=Kitasatospora purpeofusca TaxID=67352 RepID=A0ABZ1U666_9ACTN|nr:MbtH family NRPS accessory protein [Kitasatospora purpeofusca]
MAVSEPVFKVVVNHEEQYSIWHSDKELPAGWTEVGVSGGKQECLDHINEVWTDITPLSVRRALAERA